MKPAFRWPWLIAGAVALFAALLVAGLSVGDLEEALVRDANAVVAAPRLRATHVDRPRAGRFSDALRPAYGPFLAGLQATEAGGAAAGLVDDVARGERPVTDLPPDLASRLEALAPLHDAVLAASHAETADLGPDHAVFGPFPEGAVLGVQGGDSWLGVQQAARLSAIRIWLAPDATGRGRLFPVCLDALALGRDAAVSGGLVGRMVRGATVALLQPACGEALAALSPEQVVAAAARVRRIRDAVPDFGDLLREEMIQVRLLSYGRDLPEALGARLAERPRAFAADASMRAPHALGRAWYRLLWRTLEGFQREIVEAGRLPRAEREEAFARIESSHRWLGFLLGLPAEPSTAQHYAGYARRDEAARLRLDLLVAAAAARQHRARHHRWPDRIADLREGGWLDGDEAARLSGTFLVEEGRGAALRLTVPLPHGAGEAASEATVRVSVEAGGG